mmetsp:Transcript_33275/g.86294  ORF Transcript_33275/g.86294 Transcript_33275/m.86294 type:complete len:213 (+) Transcript_33275:975-1613(+)
MSFSCRYRNSIITLSRTTSTSSSVIPFKPRRSLSSMNSDMNSGDRGLRLMNVSNAWFSVLWNSLSEQKLLRMTLSNLSFSSSRCCTNSTGSFCLSGSITSCLPVSLMKLPVISRTDLRPSRTCSRLNSVYMRARSSYLSSRSSATRPEFSISTSTFIWLLMSSVSTTAVIFASVDESRYADTRSLSSARRFSALRRYSGQSLVLRYSWASTL